MTITMTEKKLMEDLATFNKKALALTDEEIKCSNIEQSQILQELKNIIMSFVFVISDFQENDAYLFWRKANGQIVYHRNCVHRANPLTVASLMYSLMLYQNEVTTRLNCIPTNSPCYKRSVSLKNKLHNIIFNYAHP